MTFLLIPQVSTLVDVDEYIASRCKGAKQPKTKADKRKWLKDQGIKTVKNPKSGKEAVPVLDRTVMLTGTRVSARREKEEEFVDKVDAKKAFSKVREDFEVAVNRKASSVGVGTYMMSVSVSRILHTVV